MSLEVLRRDAVTGQKKQLTETYRAHRRAARALRSVTNLIAKNANLSTIINCNFDAENSPPPDSEESKWLTSIDLSNGRLFDDTTLSFPTTAPKDDLTYESKPLRPSSVPAEPVHDSIEADIADSDDPVATSSQPTSSAGQNTNVLTQHALVAVSDTDEGEAPALTYLQKAREEVDGPVGAPGLLAPPQPEDEAEFSAETQELLDLESPQKPAKVVHLPPEDVQRERSSEVEEARRKRSEDDNQAKGSRSHLQTQTELASSPSSTVGAYSATTPMPAQDSPDTSPDSENGELIEVPPPKDLRPSPEEQREKAEHDRLLDAQKAIARRAAMGNVSTADDQLRYEERQASAREAEERAAREDRGGPEYYAKDKREETEADAVMDDIEGDREENEMQSVAQDIHTDSTSDGRLQTKRMQEDGENITVTPRNRQPLSIDTGRSSQHTHATAHMGQGGHERMTTRISSGVLHQRTVSELLDQTPSRSNFLSPEATSPMTLRHPQIAAITATASSSFQPSRNPKQPQEPNDPQSVLGELQALKGASKDPDRDYLEPLFRIQAHDSPNIHTTSLPDLLRSSTKTLSTEDHFDTMHERLDYRILRRIYHLQNANKWSLRQMKKCSEPEQPISHHDHMMAEMQWMRKDFKAERKMKTSVCAWLARRCADWVAASPDVKKSMQVQASPPKQRPLNSDETMPELEHEHDSPADDAGPPTPPNEMVLTSNLVVPPEMSNTVTTLEKQGRLGKALEDLPVARLTDAANSVHVKSRITPVSRWVGSRVLPNVQTTNRKRSRYEYEDDADMIASHPVGKRHRQDRGQPAEDQESALFHPDNKPIRDRLHANNAFRPPSEFVMPSTQFYEFRNGSQWVSEDDAKLRRLAKEHAFNWSLIADELQLPGVYKSSSERRTPWECFERWVDLEQLPAEMKKVMYFKTWYQRLEQSQQAAERRYHAQVTALQAANQATHVPLRRRTTPTPVEKRKNTRYIWLVDAMRKLARKKEQQAYKQAEAHRAAAQRKLATENNQSRQQIPTPQEFSKKRYAQDLRMQEEARLKRQQMIEHQQKQLQAARAAAQAQQGVQTGTTNQQRPGSSANMPAQQAQMQASGQQQSQMNGQMSQQARQAMQMAARNSNLGVPQMNGQGIPQAQMRPNGAVQTPSEMQRMAYANAQARSSQYGGQQHYQMPSANMMSPGNSGMSSQQLNQSSQAMLVSMQQQMNGAAHQSNQQISGSPSMPPPPTPQSNPQSLSSGHVPAFISIKQQLRNKFPTYTEEQVNAMATEVLKNHSQSSSHARQSAMNAAAGINGGVAPSMQGYGHNQASYQHNQMTNGNSYMNGDASGQQKGITSPSQQQYAQLMRQRQMAQMHLQQSPNGGHATLNGSPNMANASPNMSAVNPVSPSMQYNQMAGMTMGSMNRPPSQGSNPQIRSGSAGGMPSPQGVNGLQGSPRQASMAR